jgi:predicted phosphodiesterase
MGKIDTAFKTDEQWLIDEGLDPDIYLLDAITHNRWGPEDGDLSKSYVQTKIKARKKNPDQAVLPARVDGPKFKKPRTVKSYKTKPKLIVFASDQHAPYNDKRLHELFLEFLREHKPHEIILGGDLIDMPTVSRHINQPGWAASVQQGVDAGYLLCRDIREAAPKAVIKMLEGNHDIRLKTALLKDLKDLYGVGAAIDNPEDERVAALSLTRLLRLDELKIDLITDPEASSRYETAKIEICPGLTAIHGLVATRGAGRSVVKTMQDLDGSSLIQGHSHRASLTSRTVHGADGPRILWGCESGVMCDMSLAKAYTANPDWSQGFVMATIWPDSKFILELVRYEESSLLYRGSRLK